MAELERVKVKARHLQVGDHITTGVVRHVTAPFNEPGTNRRVVQVHRDRRGRRIVSVFGASTDVSAHRPAQS